MTPKELREQRAPVAAEIKRLADLANDAEHQWSSEDEQTWTRVNDDYNALSAKIERAERAEQIESEQRDVPADVPGREDRDGRETAGAPSTEDRALALQGWLRSQSQMEVTDAQAEACQRLGVRPGSSEFNVPLTRDYRAMRHRMAANNPQFRTTNYTSTTATQGGDVVPPGSLVERIERALLAYGGVRSVATIMRTASGEPLELPTNDDTSNAGELLGEVADSGDSAASDGNVSTSNLTLNSYKLSSKIVRVSHELLNDSAVDFEAFIGDVIGERLGRGMASYLTTGTGSSQPNGVVTASTAGKTAASITTVTGDELLDLMHSVDPAYRANASWMLADSTCLILRKLKDSDNQYLWQPGLAAGMPDRLLGAPVVVNQQVAAIAANAKSILYGDFSKYIVRDVGGIRIVRAPERYVEYDQVGFIGFARFDGDLLDAGTNPVKHMLHPAS